MNLYHFTCGHGRLGIGDEGKLYAPIYLGAKLPARTPAWQKLLLEMIWMTDLAEPARDALGLTSHTLGCDRTAYRYRVTRYRAMHYPTIRRDLPKRLTASLESAPGAMPMHWWVAYTPVPVVFDPLVAS